MMMSWSLLCSPSHRYYTLSNAIIVLGLVFVYLGVATVPFKRQFFEQDPEFSYYNTDAEIVPVSLLLFLSLGLAIIVIALCTLFHYLLLLWINKVNDDSVNKELLSTESEQKKILNDSFRFVLSEHLMLLCIAFLSAYASTSLVVDTLKFLFSKPRPGFFYYCNYQGYSDGIHDGNLTSYYALTDPRRLVDTDNCWASDAEAADATKSFPSGHSALSFCGMGFVCFCALQLLEFAHDIGVYGRRFIDSEKTHVPSYVQSYEAYICLRMFSFTPFILSTWIAVSRIRDYKHSELDVLVGGLIGTGMAFLFAKQLREYLRASPNAVIALLGGAQMSHCGAVLRAKMRNDRADLEQQDSGESGRTYGAMAIE